MKAKVGEKVLTVCKKHNNAIVYHNLDIGCPLCVAQETIMELEGIRCVKGRTRKRYFRCAGELLN